MAEWRNVKGYEGEYLVSNESQVYSLPKGVYRSGRYLKPGKRGRGKQKYYFVVLCRDTVETIKSIHRIVAEAFLENPNEFPEVNHKDENPFNNHVDNLEWCSRQYNIEYSKNKKIVQLSVSGEIIEEHRSITYAFIKTGIGRTAIGNALNGLSTTAGGYRWKFT